MKKRKVEIHLDSWVRKSKDMHTHFYVLKREKRESCKVQGQPEISITIIHINLRKNGHKINYLLRLTKKFSQLPSLKISSKISIE